jgi:hypothetical protein
MAKATTVKEAIKKFEDAKGVVAAEQEKVFPCSRPAQLLAPQDAQ